jgi:hypothetical protein
VCLYGSCGPHGPMGPGPRPMVGRTDGQAGGLTGGRTDGRADGRMEDGSDGSGGSDGSDLCFKCRFHLNSVPMLDGSSGDAIFNPKTIASALLMFLMLCCTFGALPVLC